MKKNLVILLSLLMVLTMAFAACSKSEDQTAADQTSEDSSESLE